MIGNVNRIKEYIEKLSNKLEKSSFYTYEQIIQMIEEKFSVEVDQGIFIDVIGKLEEERKLKSKNVILFLV